MIEDVIGLRAELEVHPLPDGKVLEDGEVRILETGADQAVPADIAVPDSPRRVVDGSRVGAFIDARRGRMAEADIGVLQIAIGSFEM